MDSTKIGRTALLSFSVGLAAAASTPALAADALAPIVVTPNRSAQTHQTVPSDVDIITRRDIERSGAHDLASLLRGNGSIHGQSLGEGSRAFISMRGFSETAHSNVLVLVDGRRLNNPDIAPPDFASISLNDVERIEIVHGSGSTLYGDQAVAGVINIITRGIAALDDEYSAQTLTRVQAFGGSYNTRGAEASMEHRNDSGFVMRLSGEDRKTDNYRDHNAQDYINGRARLGWEHRNGGIYIESQYSGDRLETPGALFANEKAANRRQSASDFSNDYSRIANRVYRIAIEQSLGSNWELNTDVSRQYTDGDFLLSFRGFPGSTSTQERTQDTVAPRITGQFDTGRGTATLTTGVDFIKNDYRLQSQLGFQRNAQKKTDVFLQTVYPVTSRVSLVIGGRYANFDNEVQDSFTFPTGASLDDDQTAWELGLNFVPVAGSRLFIRSESTYRFPKVDEVTNGPTGSTGLRTQTGQSTEIGAETSSGGLSVGVSGYLIVNDDEISVLPGAGAFGFPANVNLDKTKRKGMNFRIKARAGDHFEFHNNWHYVHSEGSFQGQNFNQLPLAARHVIDAGVGFRIAQGMRVGFEARYVDDRPLSGDFDRSQGRLPDHTVADVTFDWQWRQLRLNARVENIFDREFTEFGAETTTGARSYFPMPDRNVFISIEHAL